MQQMLDLKANFLPQVSVLPISPHPRITEICQNGLPCSFLTQTFCEEFLTSSGNVCSSKNHDHKEGNRNGLGMVSVERSVSLLILKNKYHNIKIHLSLIIQNKPNFFG